MPILHYAAPGRTELGGNHTDHQHGKVLAAAIDLQSVAAVTPNSDGKIRVKSAGFAPCEVDLHDLVPNSAEFGTTVALVRGVAAGFAERGFSCGFDAEITSDVLIGSGMSSSASFEMLIAAIINDLSGAKLPPIELAKIGQKAENIYFGKPCGLMDQTACAVGGIIGIDFADPDQPKVTALDVDFADFGYALCILDTGADHSNLTAEYAAIPEELRSVCHFFDKEFLSEVDEVAFFAALPNLRKAVSDRAILRAMHVFAENRRVDMQFAALQSGDFEAYLQLVRQSGISSWTRLQNITPNGSTEQQAVAFALSAAEAALRGKGAVRVHGGGFAGTIQAYVPLDQLADFVEKMSHLGLKCHQVSINPNGCRKC